MAQPRFTENDYILIDDARVNIFKRLNIGFDVYNSNSFKDLGNDIQELLPIYQNYLEEYQNTDTFNEIVEQMSQLDKLFNTTIEDVSEYLLKDKKESFFDFFKTKKNKKRDEIEHLKTNFPDLVSKANDNIENLVSKKDFLDEYSEKVTELKDENLEIQSLLKIYIDFVNEKEKIILNMIDNIKNDTNEDLRKKELLKQNLDVLYKKNENLTLNFQIYTQLFIQNKNLVDNINSIKEKIDTLFANFSLWKNIIEKALKELEKELEMEKS